MKREYKLISYCIPTDDGAAPNPFFGICSLAICKPVIRRVTAEVGDWIVGTGSKNVNGVDYSNRLVYVMKVEYKISMLRYDSEFPEKRPDVNSHDYKKRLGDSIYDFSVSQSAPSMREGVHGEKNRITDIGGKNVLLSKHFFYFGKSTPLIPEKYRSIVRQTQGHQYNPNEIYKDEFVKWLESEYGERRIEVEGMFGDPQLLDTLKGVCGACRVREDIEDEERQNNKCDES